VTQIKADSTPKKHLKATFSVKASLIFIFNSYTNAQEAKKNRQMQNVPEKRIKLLKN